jgi:hypothetical protein
MKSSFKYASASQMVQMIDHYFDYIKGEPFSDTSTDTTKLKKQWIREPEIPTLHGLALFLEFNSIAEFKKHEHYEKHRKSLRYARLRIEAAYEQLLFEKPTGAIFALKNMGWTDKPEPTKLLAESHKTLKVEITNTGPQTRIYRKGSGCFDLKI